MLKTISYLVITLISGWYFANIDNLFPSNSLFISVLLQYTNQHESLEVKIKNRPSPQDSLNTSTERKKYESCAISYFTECCCMGEISSMVRLHLFLNEHGRFNDFNIKKYIFLLIVAFFAYFLDSIDLKTDSNCLIRKRKQKKE